MARLLIDRFVKAPVKVFVVRSGLLIRFDLDRVWSNVWILAITLFVRQPSTNTALSR